MNTTTTNAIVSKASDVVSTLDIAQTYTVKKPRSSEVKSYGIACVNMRDKRICLVRRRNTYAFENFFRGLPMDRITVTLFNEMTLEEKLDILAFDFKLIYHRMYGLSDHNTQRYHYAHEKYIKYYLSKNTSHITKIIQQSDRSSNGIWEIPKGRAGYNEQPFNVAIREFIEETGIKSDMFTVEYSIKFIYSFTDNFVTYRYEYYLGYFNDADYQSVNKQRITQSVLAKPNKCPEIIETKWMNLDEIRNTLDDNIPCASAVLKLSNSIIDTAIDIKRNTRRSDILMLRDKRDKSSSYYEEVKKLSTIT